MKNLKAIVTSFGLAGLLFGATACGGDMISDMEKLVDEMCACKDAACLEKVEKKGEELSKKYKDAKGKPPSAEEQKKLMALGMKAIECSEKIKGAGGGEGAGGEAKPEEAKPE